MTDYTNLVKRLREGRTNGTALRWNVTSVHIEAADAIEALTAERDAALAANAWQDIATAPKDGEWVLGHGDGVAIENCTYVMANWGGVWTCCYSGVELEPTDWQSLPPPPVKP